ncbi:hypothetical protein [Crocosphaera sp. XPORK-15E]|uniref:hypothetical protein n=1 Tax=Crocosphaera sp. XPORK-15E TaxID=3110247 RepID=UPI002B206473|nr:hypothetical protein [Crocosphaera sp. XPORK-15E]MEA5535523.1 hypothetical protein [Crocosphaera sp. XPORK-15E]
MTIILDNLEPEMLKQLQNQATSHGRTLTEEIKVILINEVQKSKTDTHYNAWGKPVTKESIQNTINEMRELRKSIAIDKSDIREMREDGRRF